MLIFIIILVHVTTILGTREIRYPFSNNIYGTALKLKDLFKTSGSLDSYIYSVYIYIYVLWKMQM